MHDLTPLTALGAPRADTRTIGALTLAELDTLALASVTARMGQAASCRSALATWLGAEPPAPARASLSEERSAIWMAENQWLVSSTSPASEDIAQELAAALGQSASVTEQTGAWICFDVTGASGVDLFERLCPAPVRRFQAGDAHRTTLHHMNCFLWCLAHGQHFRVLGPSSSAGSLHHALITAAKAVA